MQQKQHSGKEPGRTQHLTAGMDAYLSKPFKQEQLAGILKEWVEMPSAADSADV